MKNVNLTVHDEMRIRDAAEILSTNLDKHLTIPKLAGMVNIAEKKLKAGFMKLFGKGVYAYLRHLRMEKIKTLLMENQPLKVIAVLTGFKSETALIKAFRRENGVPPALWKRRQENKIA